MTTIAFRNGILAADTLYVSMSHSRVGSGPKISRAPSGELLATTGFAPTAFLLRDWWLNGKSEPQPSGEHSASLIVFENASSVWVYCSGGRQQEATAEFLAYGSGADFARGAMAMGADAEEAVRIASRFCIYTGGDITTLKIPLLAAVA